MYGWDTDAIYVLYGTHVFMGRTQMLYMYCMGHMYLLVGHRCCICLGHMNVWLRQIRK